MMNRIRLQETGECYKYKRKEKCMAHHEAYTTRHYPKCINITTYYCHIHYNVLASTLYISIILSITICTYNNTFVPSVSRLLALSLINLEFSPKEPFMTTAKMSTPLSDTATSVQSTTTNVYAIKLQENIKCMEGL
jgi:hypothetical protein